MVVTEVNLWLNLMDIRKEVKDFHVDAPLLPSGIYNSFEEGVVERFGEVKVWSAALQQVHSPPSQVFL